MLALAAVWLLAQDPPQGSERQKFEEIPLITAEPGIPGPTRPVERAPSSLTVLKGEDLRRTGVRFLPDALRLVPGFEVVRLSSTESNVSARGYNDDSTASQGILCLVDGRLADNAFFGAVLWDTLPVSLDDVDRIEVVRGPGSFAHGPNAMHGLVNIVTRSPLKYKTDHTFASASVGTYGSTAASLVHVRHEGNSALKVKMAWDDIEEFEPSGENAKDKSFLELRYEVALDDPIGIPVDPEHTLDVSAGVSRQKFNVLVPTFAGIPPGRFSNDATELYVRAQYVWKHFRAQVSWTRFDAEGNPDQVYEPFELLVDTSDAEVQYSQHVLEVHTFTAGAGYRASVFETANEDVSGGRHQTGLYWAFAQDEWALVRDTLWFTGGIRWDRHTISHDATSPRFAAVWQFLEGQYLRGAAGYGFRNPSLREIWFDMQVLGGPATIRGNRDLDAEKIRTFELGYSGRLARPVRAEATLYYNLVDRLVEFRPVDPLTVAPKNESKEEAYGAETEVEVSVLEDLSAFANYSFAIRRDRDTHDEFDSAPRHKGNVGMKFTLQQPTPLVAMVWATFFDEVEYTDTATGLSMGEVDAFALLNARVTADLPIPGARAFLQAFNLLDHDHREQPQGDSYGLLLMAGLDVTW
jgi:iron complex outermembrane receptor protein